ncbi:flagellar assembly protein FliH [Agaribacterium haliotis]|uniref:flagellar assembly protein FliH n=1 Tax=Agaribacterium haliotis TaxID=2013869 RepID=UPI000BB5741E|nr:flagellar assembly protein FliH [Agaribacterium haliotis]
MSNDSENKERIPYEQIDEHSVQGWGLKPMRGRNPRTGKNAQNKNVQIDKLKQSEKPKPLTAEQLQQISEQARREGFEQGLKEGTQQGLRQGQKTGEKAGQQQAYQEARKDIEALQQQLKNCIERLFEPMRQREALIEKALMQLSLDIAQALLSEEIKTRPEIFLQVIHKVLAALPKSAENIRVLLNPADAELIQKLIPRSRQWQLEVDASIASGGLQVLSDSSEVDFSVESRIAQYLAKVEQQRGSVEALEQRVDIETPAGQGQASGAGDRLDSKEYSEASGDKKVAQGLNEVGSPGAEEL